MAYKSSDETIVCSRPRAPKLGHLGSGRIGAGIALQGGSGHTRDGITIGALLLNYHFHVASRTC